MGSTTLFAPQVRSVQPAFIYEDKKITVYFSIPYNATGDFNMIRYTLFDPNQNSLWGNNSMIKNTNKYIDINFNSSNIDNSTGEYYIEIELSDDNFKELTTNQFYQMQLRLVKTGDEEEVLSEPSQVTLIRPILRPNIHIGGDGSSVYALEELTGYIFYAENDTQESLDSCYCEINSKKGFGKCNGLNFIIPLNDFVLEQEETITGTFYYKTINGYQSFQGFTIILAEPDIEKESQNTVSADSAAAAIKLEWTDTSGELKKIQRTSEESNFTSWKTIYTLLENETVWFDFSVEANVEYKYRILKEDLSAGVSHENSIKIDFEDIFLSNENIMTAIRYNPNISGFKYVSQESITNALGGKYPIIRRNGETKYRQFNLSGTIYIDCSKYKTKEEREIEYSNSLLGFSSNPYFEDPSSLYIKDVDIFFKNTEFLNKNILEKKCRLLVMDFLTDGSPKLFRAFEEGNMIVYLSSVSFTPNKTLGRHVYDFSSTVTELCEYNKDNLKKYKLNESHYIELMDAINNKNNNSSN